MKRVESGDWTGKVWGGGRASSDDAIPMPGAKDEAHAKGADAIGLRAGDDVRHGKFGDGIIIDIIGEGDKAEAVVRFAGVGEKRLLLAWAPLEKR
jgi:DNA helicase-2/ATP-dependent DNA helicase PcrA